MNLLLTSIRYVTSQESTQRPWLLDLRSSTWFITATVCTAVFTDIFLYAVIVPVFPFSLVQRIGVPEGDVQHWLSILLSVYGAALLVFAPLFGWLSDRISSRRVVLLGGMLVLGGATVILCLARSLPLLVLGRLLQGASAGVVWVVALALLADTVGNQHAGQAMGFVGMAYSVSALLAPLLGGIVYDKSGYYAVFAMAFGMIILDITLRLLLIEKKFAKRWSTYTDQDTSLQATCLSTSRQIAKPETIAKPNQNLECSEEDPSPTCADQPATPPKKTLPPILILLKSRRMQATFFASTISAIVLTGFDVTLPLFVQQIFGWNALGAGLIFLASLSPSFFQPLYGICVDRYGARWIASMGLLITVPPFVCLRFVTHNSMTQKVLLCALLAVIGFGVSLTLAAVMAEFTWICAEKEKRTPGSMGKGGAYAQSYGLFNVSWALGSLVGSYFAGGIKEAAGFGAMGWSFALLCGVFAVPTVMFVGGGILQKREKKSDKVTKTAIGRITESQACV